MIYGVITTVCGGRTAFKNYSRDDDVWVSMCKLYLYTSMHWYVVNILQDSYSSSYAWRRFPVAFDLDQTVRSRVLEMRLYSIVEHHCITPVIRALSHFLLLIHGVHRCCLRHQEGILHVLRCTLLARHGAEFWGKSSGMSLENWVGAVRYEALTVVQLPWDSANISEQFGRHQLFHGKVLYKVYQGPAKKFFDRRHCRYWSCTYIQCSSKLIVRAIPCFL